MRTSWLGFWLVALVLLPWLLSIALLDWLREQRPQKNPLGSAR